VEFRPATDPADEARRAAEDARRWIGEGVAPEEIAIVVPGPAHRLGAMARELSRRGVAHHARRAAPVLETAAAQAGLVPFWLLEEGFPRERMEAWVASPLTSALDSELLLPAIARGPVSGGTRDEWNRALSAAQGESAARLVAAIAGIDELGRAEAAPAEFWPRYGEVLVRVGLLPELAARDPAGLALWERALRELRVAHETLGTWTGPARSWRVHRRALLEALGEPRSQLGRPGRGVEILTARDARGLAFRRQLLVGLVQGALTRQGAASSILGDPERRLLNQSLGRRAFRTSSEEAFESDLLLVERIRSTSEAVVLSWPVEDENATPLLPGLEVERERERRGASAPEAPVQADVPAWRDGRDAISVTALQELERGRTMFFSRPPATRRATAGRADGAFDPVLVAALRQEVVAAPWSASALESWGQCAHQYFERHILRLRPPDDRPLEAEARTVGDLAHLALKRLFEEGGPWDAERVRSAVDAAADSVRDHRRGAAAVWAVTRRRVVATLVRYLRTVADAAPPGRGPVALETSFGREGAAIPAVVIDTGYGPISLRGTIDRLDRDSLSGDLHVIDYKYSFKGKDHTEAVDPERCGVDRFQLYAYFLGALAWEELGGAGRAPTVTAAIHCIKSASIAGPVPMPDPERVRAAIARAVESAAGGVFDPTPRDPRRCRYCDFRRSCRIATVPGLAAEDDEVEA
jgi:RecB family exonuclease